MIFRKLVYLTILCLYTQSIIAQLPHDAIMMPKKTWCVAIIGQQNKFSEYWEGTLKRDNPNIGTNSTQAVMPMIAYGISKKSNLIASLPFIKTENSAGTLRGESGIQDLSVWFKTNLLQKGRFNLLGTLGASMPIGNYHSELLPMSIGYNAKTLSGRLIAQVNLFDGFYINASGNYIARSKIVCDKNGYQSYGKIINSATIAVPNATEATARIGYYKKGIQLEGFVEQFSCTSGDDIRRNDMPTVTNEMRQTMIGTYAKYQPKNIGLNARYRQVINGKNVGQTTHLMIGLLFQINPKRKEASDEK